jgi:hypothetical protein
VQIICLFSIEGTKNLVLCKKHIFVEDEGTYYEVTFGGFQLGMFNIQLRIPESSRV